MSTENAGQAETVEQCTDRMMKSNQGMTADQAKAACMAQKSAGASSPNFNLTEAMTKVMKDYGDMMVTELKKQIGAELTKAIEDTKKELVDAVRAGVGLSKDPVLHMSEIEGVVRKILLDAVPPGKRTETATPDKPDGKDVTKTGGADGTASPIKPAAQRFQELAEGKGAA